MSSDVRIVIHFKDLEVDEPLRDHMHARCEHLATEFPEAMSFEVTVEKSPHSVDCHGHVSGKRTRTAAHTSGQETARHACDAFFEKLERELRTDHDKRIFGQRRKAQKNRHEIDEEAES